MARESATHIDSDSYMWRLCPECGYMTPSHVVNTGEEWHENRPNCSQPPLILLSETLSKLGADRAIGGAIIASLLGKDPVNRLELYNDLCELKPSLHRCRNV